MGRERHSVCPQADLTSNSRSDTGLEFMQAEAIKILATKDFELNVERPTANMFILLYGDTMQA